ncbi:hypothetical protein SeMB42_g01352 [Synchytrium endobioticum]|uniref:Uncharacterized protein n=1 Tax=Synchytrium endobioticum TaxID=286115 RepID=A0A507DLN0_9FUNG|nr:hypothetical protein SeMB42_g01352 [Synchytrium endobioticum]
MRSKQASNGNPLQLNKPMMVADESTLALLKGFVETKSEWNVEFDQILLRIADTCYTEGIPWALLKEMVRFKIKKNVHSHDTLGKPNGSLNKGETIAEYEERIDEALDSFEEPPFTIQRLCELITSSSGQHRSIWAYLRALEKVLLVTSSDVAEHTQSYSTADTQPSVNNTATNDNDGTITTAATTDLNAMIMSPPPLDPLPPQVLALGANPAPSPFDPILRPATPPAAVSGLAPDSLSIASGIAQQHNLDDDPMDTD